MASRSSFAFVVVPALIVSSIACSNGAGNRSADSPVAPAPSLSSLPRPQACARVLLPCDAPGLPPTLSCALASWPSFNAAAPPDLTPRANVRSAPVQGSPAGVSISPSGAWVFVASKDAANDGRVEVLARKGDTLTPHAAMVFPNDEPFGLAQSRDGKMLAVALGTKVAFHDLTKLEIRGDPADTRLGTVDTHAPHATTIDLTFSIDGSLLFAANEYDKKVAVVDVRAMKYIGSIPIAGDAVTSVVASPDGKRVYIVNEVADAFKAKNPTPPQDQHVGLVTVADVAKAATDPATAVIGSVFVGRAPVRVVLSKDGATAWVSARGSNALVALDTAKIVSAPGCAYISTTAVGLSPVGLARFDAPGKSGIFVANSNRFANPPPPSTVMLVDATKALAGAPDAVTGSIAVGAFPREMDLDATALFVSNYSSQTVSGIDLTSLLP